MKWLQWGILAPALLLVAGDLRIHVARLRLPSGAVAAFHWGSNPGFKSFALVDRGRGIGVVILTNGDNGLELVEDIFGIIDPKVHPLFHFYMLHPDN